MKKCLFFILLFTSKIAFAIDIVNTDKYYLSLNSYILYNITGKDKLDVYGIGGFDSTFEYINDKNTIGIYNSYEFDGYSKKTTISLKDLYLYNENDYGRIEIGKTKNILSKIHNKTHIFFLKGDITKLNNFLFPDEIHGFDTEVITDDRVFKINYITPKLNRLQFAGFYLPDTKNDKIKNGVGGGMKYFYSSSFDLNTSFSIAEFNNVNDYGINKDKIREYSVGTIFYKQALQFSTALKLTSDTKEIIKRNFDLGFAYEIGALQMGVSNYTSYVSKTDFYNLTILSSRYKFNNMTDFEIGLGNLYSQTDNNNSPLIFLTAGIKF